MSKVLKFGKNDAFYALASTYYKSTVSALEKAGVKVWENRKPTFALFVEFVQSLEFSEVPNFGELIKTYLTKPESHAFEKAAEKRDEREALRNLFK